MKHAWLAGVLALAFATPSLASEKEDLAAEAWVVLEKGVRSGDMMARARAVEALPLVPGKTAAAIRGLVRASRALRHCLDRA